jgi:PIN domain nuclease of toxin-antitoxin system
MPIVNLDTHVLVYALAGSLRPRERTILAGSDWSISGIVLWEVAKLVQLGRLSLDLEDRQVLRVLAQIRIWPIDLEIARASTRLDFRSDPADELIAATSLVHGIPLLTRDKTMRGSKKVPLAIRG